MFLLLFGGNGHRVLACPVPLSESDVRISRIRFSSQWFAPVRKLAVSEMRASSKQKNPDSVK
jgi:hypothetical protein